MVTAVRRVSSTGASAQVSPGNQVVIDHGHAEFSFLAHLQQGSVAVQPGQSVAPGDTLGLCGNSGNSSEPHLHYHLQDSGEFGAGEGKPAQFRNYTADGEWVEVGEPVQGQRIRPADAAAPAAPGRPAAASPVYDPDTDDFRDFQELLRALVPDPHS